MTDTTNRIKMYKQWVISHLHGCGRELGERKRRDKPWHIFKLDVGPMECVDVRVNAIRGHQE